MIRHRVGNEFLLIGQNDHAVFSGQLAGHFGNDHFGVPSPFLPTVQGIAMHDCGWPLHDQAPTLDGEGLPTHVFKTPTTVSTMVWRESVRRAAQTHPWSGLLVSIHVLYLSSLATASVGAEQFELNKFQHAQIEFQEKTRQTLGMRTDVPLRLGLSPPGIDEEEDLLLFDAGLMKLCDSLSLDACCGEELFATIEGVRDRPGGQAISFRLTHLARFTIGVEPWPFDVDEVSAEVEARRVGASPFASVEAFREAYELAPVEYVRPRMVRG